MKIKNHGKTNAYLVEIIFQFFEKNLKNPENSPKIKKI